MSNPLQWVNLSLCRKAAGRDRCTMNATDGDRPTPNLSPTPVQHPSHRQSCIGLWVGVLVFISYRGLL